ncbi:MAG: hypothetical protein NTW14_05395 [bacterium]|nr:hypothetical protein [bacterium]
MVKLQPTPFKLIATLTSLYLFGFVLISCGGKMSLPSSPQNVTFSAGDTTYIHLAPDWTFNNGILLSEPCDLVIGPDDLVFVADRGNRRVAVFDRAGSSISGYGIERLTDLDSIAAIGQDEKLNLFLVTGGSAIYYWNQYVNATGVQSVLDHLVVYDTTATDTLNLSFEEYGYLSTLQAGRYVVIDALFSTDPDRIDSVLGPSIFYQEPNDRARYRGVAGGPDETVYVTDLYDRVSRFKLIYHNLVVLENGQYGFTYRGEYDMDVAGPGTGMGTTTDPAGIYIQVQGSQHYIYFSQTAENFRVQKIREEGTGNFFPAFSPTTDIMQLGRFGIPKDIWVAEQYLGNNWIFVAEQDSNRISVFNPMGAFLMYAGVKDSSGVQVFDELFAPEGVAHSKGTLYVADTGNNRIVRYALSTDVENIPGE